MSGAAGGTLWTHCLGAVSFWAFAICIIVSYTLSRPNFLAVCSQLGNGRRRAGQGIHGYHDHASSRPGPGASEVGRSKTLREQISRNPGSALQGGGHENYASPQRNERQRCSGQGRASLGKIRISEKEKPQIRFLSRTSKNSKRTY